MINNMEKKFFNENIIIINELSKYAPSDRKLLSIPQNINITDPLFKPIFQLPNDPNVNNFLIGLNLLAFLQSVNRALSKVYAAHQYIIENKNLPENADLSQSEIDYHLYKGSMIFQEYNCILREFISLLRIAVDQLITLFITNFTKKPIKCDCIGDFLKMMETYSDEIQNINKKFLVGLNVSANYLKHHPYQLEGPSSIFPLLTPSLLVMVDTHNKKSKHDCEGLKKFFNTELAYYNNSQISCWISCDFLVSGFNYFYKQLIENSLTHA